MAVLKDLIVHGPSRFLNGINVNKVEADAIKADSGYFNQLIATSLEAKNAHIDELTANNATVFGVMDVKGKLQTNQWEAASIANVGGNFYISPTGKSATGTITITRTTAASGTTSAKYSVTMSGTFGVSTTSSTIWANGAYGMATGNVSIGTKKYPLGTCDGPLSGISTGTNTITGFTISSIESSALDLIFDENMSLISSNAISNQSGTDLQVSVYLGKSGNNYMPVGILLTSYGKDNKQYIDIYDGEHSAGTAITGFANPVVRIGDLSGLNSYTQSGKYTITPTGWGIYTENGFFNGAVYSEIGYIGGWTIGSTNLHNPPTRTAWNTNASGIWIATDVIAGGAQTGSAVSGKYAATDPKWYIKANGDVKFGELTYINGTLSVPAAKVSGKLTAATIDGGQITANTITAGQIATNAITADELSANAVTADKLDATTINTSGKLTVGAMTSAAANSILNSEVKVGGRNLALESNTVWDSADSTAYNIIQGTLSEDWIAGETYTIQIKGTPSSGKKFGLWRDAGNVLMCFFYNQVNGVWTTTVTCPAPASEATDFNKFSIYDYDSTGDHSAHIDWIKIEKGNKATDWSPAPEDIATGIEDAIDPYDNIINGDEESEGLQQIVERLANFIIIDPDGGPDGPSITIQTINKSEGEGNPTSASVKITDTKQSFSKNGIEVMYLDSSENDGSLDINNVIIHNSIRIGGLEIFDNNGNIAIRGRTQ